MSWVSAELFISEEGGEFLMYQTNERPGSQRGGSCDDGRPFPPNHKCVSQLKK
jgi:hypothetical protein